MSDATSNKQTLFPLSVAALGVVYGDIGTSPLYAMRESLRGLPIDSMSILGILSIIFWSLTAIISIKYLIVLLRADNHGEGGILALLALVNRTTGAHKTTLLFFIGIFGAGLILGDGMLTPSISVLSAVEGIDIVFPSPSDFVTPVTCTILVLLFSVQRLGTTKIGFIFGPIILIWFLTLAALGIPHIMHNPTVLKAINPLYAIHFFQTTGWTGYALLGGVFLVATGAEALYADLGHFGKKPIRMSWFIIALPALLLNYFGQGAFLLEHPEAITNPFYLSAPSWSLILLLCIATMATIIASQAVISATYSIVRQAIILGLYPRMPIIQTSPTIEGQVYIPQMNLVLLIGALFLILIFKNASALTHAYGIAVNLDMVLTTALALFVAYNQWRWRWLALLFLLLGFIDLAFLGANLQKLSTGGWMPISLALSCALLMYTWHEGRAYLGEKYYIEKSVIDKILDQFDFRAFNRIPDTTAVFITDVYDQSGSMILNFLRTNLILPENIILVNYMSENIPHVPNNNRFEVTELTPNICALTLRYGFMDTISIPSALAVVHEYTALPFQINLKRMMYLIEIPNVVASRKEKTFWHYWRAKVFAFLVRNYSAIMDIEFYHLPFNYTLAVGAYYII
jgi:KUP system potassium uptake protein